jgi:hypothetical protein
VIQEPLGDALGDFAIKDDNGDYRDHGDNSIQVQSIMLHIMQLSSVIAIQVLFN